MVKTRIKFAGASDPGRVRGNNEDAFHVDADRGIFLVVDGIGGQNAGEKAAEIAVARLRARLERQTGTTEQRIREAIANANNEILRAAHTNPDWEGMACVLTVVVLENGSAVVGHVGDSRLYRLRPGAITKITHDHSPVGEREDSGELTEAEAIRHPRRNEVFRDVGSQEHTPDDPEFIEVRRFDFDADNALLLCSDGLSDQVKSADILRMVERNAGNPDAGVRQLIDAANQAGGKDNVTVVLVEGHQFVAPPPEPAASHRTPFWVHRYALFLYGILLTGGAAWYTRPQWTLPPKIVAPRELIAGVGAPYPTIEAAIQEARAGDTVEVMPGTYREAVKLKSGVTLRSRISREAILRAAPENGTAVTAGAGVKGARLSGFTIVGDAQSSLPLGVLLDHASVEVDDMDIAGAGVGIEIRGGSPRIIGNAIHDCTRDGILIVDGGTPRLSANTVQRNKEAGLRAQAGTRPILVGNVFEKNIVDLPADVSQEQTRNFYMDGKAGKKK